MADTNETKDVVEEGIHNYSPVDTYVAPTDELLQERLETDGIKTAVQIEVLFFEQGVVRGPVHPGEGPVGVLFA
ncbi:hypothetical protein FACS1894142_8420 [Spirochaetia bacterium]|nr:hypothetical protein FACS1894142_8420 [Spirochaetia bacterium]